jgi:hypothetical protein
MAWKLVGRSPRVEVSAEKGRKKLEEWYIIGGR